MCVYARSVYISLYIYVVISICVAVIMFAIIYDCRQSVFDCVCVITLYKCMFGVVRYVQYIISSPDKWIKYWGFVTVCFVRLCVHQHFLEAPSPLNHRPNFDQTPHESFYH